MLWRFLLVGLVCFLVGATAMFVAAPWSGHAPSELPVCPLPGPEGFAALPPELVAAAGAYEAIRETLERESIDGVAAQAEVLVRSFAASDPKLSLCAKRLAGEQDVESARRAFMRLHRLLDKHAQSLPRP